WITTGQGVATPAAPFGSTFAGLVIRTTSLGTAAPAVPVSNALASPVARPNAPAPGGRPVDSGTAAPTDPGPVSTPEPGVADSTTAYLDQISQDQRQLDDYLASLQQ